jgi:hypothetical protein
VNLTTHTRLRQKIELQVGVTRAEHGGETGHFHFAAAFLARLFKVPVVPDFFESAFAVNALFQTAQSFLHRFTLF